MSIREMLPGDFWVFAWMGEKEMIIQEWEIGQKIWSSLQFHSNAHSENIWGHYKAHKDPCILYLEIILHSSRLKNGAES